MRSELATVKNVLGLQAAYQALSSRDSGIPGMGLVHGFTGAGKTTSIAWLVNQVDGVFVRANATWTPVAMLGAIMTELGAAPLGRCAPMLNFIVEKLSLSGRPLFVDESDYLTENHKMLETLRDIHDVSQVPVIMIGMNEIAGNLTSKHPQLSRRISQWIKFIPADIDDSRILADTVCEVKIADDLLTSLHREAKGSMGLMVVGMSRIEALAKTNKWEEADCAKWNNRPFFLSRPPKGRR